MTTIRLVDCERCNRVNAPCTPRDGEEFCDRCRADVAILEEGVQ